MIKSRMILGVLLVAVVLALACAPAAPPATPTPQAAAKATPASTPTTPPKPTATPTEVPLEKVALHHGSYTTLFIPFFIARDKGYFAEEGLDVELRLVTSAVSVKDLIAGGHEFEGNMGSSKNAILQGANLKVVFAYGETSPWYVWGRPEIKSLEDLKGKRIAVFSRGFVGEVHSSVVLRKRGIDPEKDIFWVPTGPGAALVGVAKAGQVEAAVESLAGGMTLQKAGLHMVSRVGDEVVAATTGIAVNDKFLKERPQTVKKMVRALTKALKFYHTQSPDARAYFRKYVAEYFPTLTPEEADQLYDEDARYQVMGTGYIDETVMKADLEMAKAELGVKEDVPFAKIYDFSLVKQASDELKDWKP